MNSNALLAVQAALAAGQIVNAGVGTVTHNGLAILIVGAAVTALQVVAQHIGNQSTPEAKK